MLSKRFLISWLAVFISLMAYGFIVYNFLLGDYFASNKSTDMMRPVEEQLPEWMAIGSALIAYAFVRIFDHDYKGTGIGEGIRYGLLMGVFWGSVEFIFYATMPVPLNLVFVSFVVDVGMFVTSGIVLSTVYRKVSA